MAKSSKVDINHLKTLANLPLSPQEEKDLEGKVGVTVDYVSQLKDLPTEGVTETAQVTGMTNVFREDEVDKARVLSQEDALKNAKRVHNGFFVVDAVLHD